MNVGIVGCGYVGLSTALSFALNKKFNVTGFDIDSSKINKLSSSEMPIYEKDFEDSLKNCLAAGNLKFTDKVDEFVKNSDYIFFCLPTPTNSIGRADMKYMISAIEKVVASVHKVTTKKYLIIKSTVPPNEIKNIKNTIVEIMQEAKMYECTADGFKKAFDDRFSDLKKEKVSLFVIPEFLREGQALQDATNPDRIVIGAETEEEFNLIKNNLYSDYSCPILHTTLEDASLIKYGSNLMLATKISFINFMALMCSKYGGNISDVSNAIGKDHRIGPNFLNAGIGFGGSCFPKDVLEFQHMSKEEVYPNLPERVLQINKAIFEHYVSTIMSRVVEYLKFNNNKIEICVWGLAFKKGTSDTRESRGIELIKKLLQLKDGNNIIIKAYDPMWSFYGTLFDERVELCNNKFQALCNSNFLCITTEWDEFKLDTPHKFCEVTSKDLVIFDGRNIFDPDFFKDSYIEYNSIGRKVL